MGICEDRPKSSWETLSQNYLIVTFRVENECHFEAILDFKLVLGVWETLKPFSALTYLVLAHFRVLNGERQHRSVKYSIFAMPS
jgi:hypothetical protein